MSLNPYELVRTPAGVTARVHARGPAVLGASGINRGTAFTLPQREALGSPGCCPPGCPPWRASSAGSTRSTRPRAVTCASGCC